MKRPLFLLVALIGFLVVAGQVGEARAQVTSIKYGEYKFSYEVKVRVVSGVPSLEVWDSDLWKVVGSRSSGDVGKVLDGPKSQECNQFGCRYYFWQVEWSDGTKGWSREDSLERTMATAALTVGDLARPIMVGISMRSQPSALGSVIANVPAGPSAPPGVQCEILEGPVPTADGYTWWNAKCLTYPPLNQYHTGWVSGWWLEKLDSGGEVIFEPGLQLNDWVKITENVRIREVASLAGRALYMVRPGTRCKLLGGPVSSDGYKWWKVDCSGSGGMFGNDPATGLRIEFVTGGPGIGTGGYGGWMVENWMEEVGGPGANQPPKITSITGPTTVEAMVPNSWQIKVSDPPEGGMLATRMTWGDGTKREGAWEGGLEMEGAETHYYAQPGNYTMVFTVTDLGGLTASTSFAITVTPSSVDIPGGGGGGEGRFYGVDIIGWKATLLPNEEGTWTAMGVANDSANNAIRTLIIDWGDGSSNNYDTTSVPFSPGSLAVKHKYTAPGIYTIKMTAVNAAGLHQTVVSDAGVVDPALATRFSVGERIRTTGNAKVVNLWLKGYDNDYSWNYNLNNNLPASLGSQSKYAIGKILSGPHFQNHAWWWRVDFSSSTDGWVSNDTLDKFCPALTDSQRAAQTRFAEGECVWTTMTGVYRLNVRKEPSISSEILEALANYINIDGNISVKDNQGIVVGGPVEAGGFVWWEVIWTSGVRGWSAGNWLASERSKPKVTSGQVTTVATTTVRFTPNGQVLGEWSAGKTGTIDAPQEFVGDKWWYRVLYTQPPRSTDPATKEPGFWTRWYAANPTWQGWSEEEVFFGSGGGSNATSTIGSGITIISPVAGEVWNIGDTMVIRWTASSVVTRVHIYLAGVGLIISDVPNTGSYSWLIPSTFNGRSLGGLSLSITVYSADVNFGYSSTSGLFSIGRGRTSGFAKGCTVKTTANLNVRVAASTGAAVVGTVPLGTEGLIVDGPVSATAYTWWRMDFPGNYDGWSVEQFLARLTCP